MLTMVVLAVSLTAVIFLTSATARDAHRSNAGQKAAALAESGINNALAVLNANYPGTTIYPGDSTLLPATTTTSASGTGSVTWSGTLVNVPANPRWKWQWQLTALGRVKNPTGPAADVVRRATAVVPVVIPDSTSVPPGTTATDWIYGLNDVTFGQSVNVAAPVYAGHDLILANTATIAETIPASLTLPARPNRIVVGHDLTLMNPQNQVGHVNGSAYPANDLAEIHVGELCAVEEQPDSSRLRLGEHRQDLGRHPRQRHPARAYLTTPTLDLLQSHRLGGAGRRHIAPSVRSLPELHGLLVPQRRPRPELAVCNQQRHSAEVRHCSGGRQHDQRERLYERQPVRSHRRHTYSCTSADGQTKLAWDGSHPQDPGHRLHRRQREEHGRRREVRRQGDDHPQRALLDGQQHRAVREPLGSGCSTSAPWDADTTALAIVAAGVDTSVGPLPGNSIEIKKGNFQGMLLATGNIVGSVSGTLVVGPMVSVYGSVDAGQSGTLQFPPITFASSGTDGLTGPLPLPRLLPPIQFGGG